MVKLRYPRRPICLVYYDPILLVYKLVPLKSIQYDVEIRGPIALVKLTQVYYNSSNSTINVNYEFPKTEESCFTNFEAKFEDRTVVGQIKPKEQAKQEFEAHKAIGSTVAYAESKDNEEDIMKIELGNFPAQQPLTITFTYVEPLDLVATTYWKFIIPSCLTPRYQMNEFAHKNQQAPSPAFGSNQAFVGKFAGAQIGGALIQNQGIILGGLPPIIGGGNFQYIVEQQYTWNVNVNLYQSTPNPSILCATHRNEVLVSNASSPDVAGLYMTKISLNPGNQHYPNKDFELMFTDSNFHKPSVEVMTKNDLTDVNLPKRCAMMHLVPQFADYAKFDNEGNVVSDESDEIAHYMQTVKSEFLFIIDRSGSMSGERIKIAVNALTLALRSLPYDSYFNIVSFGNSFKFMHPTAVKADQNSITTALSKVATFRADMGGTEILNPLTACFHAPPVLNYQRTIFLLTDGDVSNAVDVVNKTREKCTLNQSRVFTIGIGNGVSDQFIKGVARAGNGGSEIIHNLTVIEDKVISLLQSSYSPALSNFRLEYDTNAVEAIAPFYSQSSHVLKDKPLQMYAFIKNNAFGITSVKMTYFDSVKAKDVSIKFDIDLNKSCGNMDYFHKLMVRDLIRDTDYGLNKTVPPGPWQTNIAVNYQVLCPKTAFLCVIKDARVHGSNHANGSVIVPQIQSVDYTGQNSHHASPVAANYRAAMPPQPYVIQGIGQATRGDGMGHCIARIAMPESASRGGFLGSIASSIKSMAFSASESRTTAQPKSKKSMPNKNESANRQRLSEAKFDCNMNNREMCQDENDDYDMIIPSNEKMNAFSPSPAMQNFSQPQSVQIQSSAFNAQGDMKFNAPTSAAGVNPDTLVAKQTFNGEFAFDGQILGKIINNYAQLQKTLGLDNNTFMTLVVTAWFKKFHNSPKFNLIVNKAIMFLKTKNVTYKDVESQVTPLLN